MTASLVLSKDEKRGAGVDGFEIRLNLFNTWGFGIIRVDGTRTDFSYLTCIDGHAPTPLQQVLEAMRREVQYDILEAKRAYFQQHANAEGRIQCPVIGRMITIEESHADHACPRTFGTLAVAFFKGQRYRSRRFFGHAFTG